MGTQEGLNFITDLAKRGVGHDHDGYYGTQCVDLINGYLVKSGYKALGGNAIDLLNSAKAAGYQVVYDAPGVNPKKGAIFVSEVYAHKFGHTGVVIEDSDGITIKTIEQNVDGNSDALTKGGPARFITRKFSDNYGKIIGWFYPTATLVSNNSSKSAQFLVKVSISNLNVRQSPSLSAKITGQAKTGTYTIIETKTADGLEWGKLKSGLGWIALKYTNRL